MSVRLELTPFFKTSSVHTSAIGDVHGRADLLERLLEHTYVNLPRPRVVFLGDIIDRGPDSRQCMNLVEQELSRQPASVLIQGNH
ncbi:hypothetical protein E5S70_30335 [Ensifer adhaerens]|uniref:metallophosphoesterase n=1 Tax=Ensifer canadensis TaxID=555315 RepID=UPI00148F98F1|nr:metallophosphoesterase [Ensifer canadensis]NOV20304.1 hypothetical protein [Ensifer canadensis]